MASFEEHTVTYDDEKKVFYLAAGPSAGPLLIFMHGWPGIGKTWLDQLTAFASLGFRVVAPDMPGYGKSTARKVHSDYAQENVIRGMLAVLADTGRERAIWVAHDWGCGTLWTLANTHPQVCRAVAGLCVPYATIEYGFEELLRLVNREVYPEAEFPFGQWSYLNFYEQSFDKATEWMEKDIPGFLKAILQNGKPAEVGKPSPLANATKDGGWFGGIEKPPSPEFVPDGNSCMDTETLKELTAAMQHTGFYPGNSWYMNHQANREYSLANSKHDGKLKMPVLFIHARYDTTCEEADGKLTVPMRERCEKLTETYISAGHWVASEKPLEVNSALARWVVEEAADWWPGYWGNSFVKSTPRANNSLL